MDGSSEEESRRVVALNDHTEPDYLEDEWYAVQAGLPFGYRDILVRMERAARGLEGVNRILRADSTARDVASNDTFSDYKALSGNLVESLEEAQQALLDVITKGLTEIQNCAERAIKEAR
jgi:hypothetical protein